MWFFHGHKLERDTANKSRKRQGYTIPSPPGSQTKPKKKEKKRREGRGVGARRSFAQSSYPASVQTAACFDCRVLLLPLLTVFRVLGRWQAGASQNSSYSSYVRGLRGSCKQNRCSCKEKGSQICRSEVRILGIWTGECRMYSAHSRIAWWVVLERGQTFSLFGNPLLADSVE